MNDLFATWQHRAEADVAPALDPAECLVLARDRLVEIPELKDALRLVDLAIGEVSAWFADGLGAEAVRSSV